MRRLTEEEEEAIAARWRRAKATWRNIGRAAFVAFLIAAGACLYYAGEGVGALSCIRPSATP